MTNETVMKQPINPLAKEYGFFALLRFTSPSMIMLMFISLYTIVDGIFVGQFVDSDALAAINIVFPVIGIINGVSFMFSTGGRALVSKQLGLGETKKATQSFSLIVVSAVLLTILLSALAFIFSEQIITLFGGAEIMDYCKGYLLPFLIFLPISSLQILFQEFLVTANKPKIGLYLTIAAGVTNAVLDYVFIVIFKMGITGAAIATGIGFTLPAGFGLYFFIKNKTGLHFVMPKLDFRVLKNSCVNGSSEMITNISGSITTILFNLFMMKLLGDQGTDGVAAMSIIFYANFVMLAMFFGFSVGTGSLIGYHYGARNTAYLKKLIAMIFTFVIGASLIIFVLSMSTKNIVASLFSPENANVVALTKRGISLFSFAYIFAGFNVLASALFTSLSDGISSAVISFSRTMIFTIGAILIMATLFGVDGLFLAVPVAEFLTCILSISILARKAVKKKLFVLR